ncbi:MAG: BrnT family toxin [Acidobacteriota bacterium]
MEFEFDTAKSHANKDKHGIDFLEAQELWGDPDRLEIPARSEDEPRVALLAQHNGKIWAAFLTYRGEKVRLISVRRAGEKEVALYHES